MDVSAYLVNAATRQMAETDAADAQFAHIDAMIAAAESEAEYLPAQSEITDADLTEEEREEVRAAMDLVYGNENPGERPGRAA